MKRSIMIIIPIAAALTWMVQPALAQEKGRKILIIPGDLNIPYEIVDGVIHVETVQSTLMVNAFEKAIAEGFKKLEQLIRNETAADAVINTSVQLVLYAAKSRSGEMGQVVIFGTLVKYK